MKLLCPLKWLLKKYLVDTYLTPKSIKVVMGLLAPLSQEDSECLSENKGSPPGLDYSMDEGSYKPNAK